MDQSVDDRKWFKKKRFLIPGAFVFVGAIASGGSDEPVAAPEVPAAVALADDVDAGSDVTAEVEEVAAIDEGEPEVEESASEVEDAGAGVPETDTSDDEESAVVAASEEDGDVEQVEAVSLDEADDAGAEPEEVEFETYDCNGTPLDVPVGNDGAELCDSISSTAFMFTIQNQLPEVADRADVLDIWDAYEETGRLLCDDFNPGSTDEEFGFATLLTWGRLDADVQSAFNDDPLVFAEFVGISIGSFCPQLVDF